MRFEWDPNKNHENRQKHGISFEQASGLFKGEGDYFEIYDFDHSDEEDRFIAIGAIVDGVLVVVFTEREEDLIRIISARPATPREVRMYQSYMERES
ncbi:MAG: BrnT family toxin [Myxococcota bacterium]